jgi:hypothetical protein
VVNGKDEKLGEYEATLETAGKTIVEVALRDPHLRARRTLLVIPLTGRLPDP